MRRKVKPSSQDDLVRGIRTFWEDHVDVAKCQRYILHLRKVLPRVIERGGPTGLQSGGLAGAGVLAIKSAYRLVSVHPDDRWLLGVEWYGDHFVDGRSASALLGP